MMQLQYQMMQQQAQQAENANSKQLELIASLQENDQKAALEELARKNAKALEIQKEKFEKKEIERRAEADRQVELMKANLASQHQLEKKALDEKLKVLSESQTEERKALLKEQAAAAEKYEMQISGLQVQMHRKELEHAEKLNEMMKIVEKKNYESHYSIPDKLKKHIETYKNSFRIQILGCRGAGKSTFVNKFCMKAGMGRVAATGCNETTKQTAFYDITQKISNKPDRYDKVFICDQPGIGGLEITEAGYLNQFGPGKINTKGKSIINLSRLYPHQVSD